MSLEVLLPFAFSVGILHAFDADHVMAMSVIASGKNKLKRILYYSIKWGLGHGGIIIAVGSLFLFSGFQFEPAVFGVAEFGAGLLLCVLGFSLLWSLRSKTIEEHGSANSAANKRLFKVYPAEESEPASDHGRWGIKDHTPMFVGLVHGLAGSASIVAILPSLSTGSTAAGLTYLVVFVMACLLGMTGFGFMLAKTQSYIYARGELLWNVFRGALATASVALGAYWILS